MTGEKNFKKKDNRKEKNLLVKVNIVPRR